MSRLLAEIDRRLSLEADDYVRAELLAKRAAYLARTGAFEEARTTITEVRSRFGDGRSGRVTVLLMVAEGLLLHFENLEPGAMDRLMRAELLAQAGRDAELIGLASAWKAHLEFEQSKYAASARSIRSAISSASPDHHATGSRDAAVLCNAFVLIGRGTDAQRQFLLGRDHAIKEGDQAALDALLYNRAAFGLARLRALSCSRPVDAATLGIARTELNSARNLQQLTRIQSLASYVELADARLAILEGRWDYACVRLKGIEGAGPLPKGHFNDDLRVVDQAYCLGRLGRLDDAHHLLSSRGRLNLGDADVDDTMVANWQLAELSRMDGRFGLVDELDARVSDSRDAYDAMIEEVGRAFGEFAAN